MDEFTWNIRIRSESRGQAAAYARGQRFTVGDPVEFDEQGEQVSALEYVMAAFGGDLVNGMQAAARRHRIAIDQIEAVVSGTLVNPLAYLGVVGEGGHPSLGRLTVRVYVSTDDDESRVQGAWEEMLSRSPLVHTLAPAVALELSIRVTS